MQVGKILLEYLDKPAENLIDKTRKIHHDYIYDFVFDNGRIQNIALLDKKHIQRNFVQVIHQFEQTGTQANRYDVTILINGLPLIQIELKKRGVAIKEAFNQIHRYTKKVLITTIPYSNFCKFCHFKWDQHPLFCQYYQAR